LRCSRYCDTGSRARRKPDRVSWWTWFSSRRMVLCNFKSANHVRFFQPDNTLNPEEPSFLPADGVERIINLRSRVRQRLKENAEVVGADETFFDDETSYQPLYNLYNEKSGILDGDDDTEVDLASYAYQIWKNAIDANQELEKIIQAMPNVVFSTRSHAPTPEQPEGALVYLRTAEGHDALAWVNTEGKSVTESQYMILRAAECPPDTPPAPRHDNHHEMVAQGVKLIVDTEKSVGGQLGRPSGARFRTYERLKKFADDIKGTLL